jgi:hypothetical protein
MGQLLRRDKMVFECVHFFQDLIAHHKGQMSTDDLCMVLNASIDAHQKGADVGDIIDAIFSELRRPSRKSSISETASLTTLSTIVRAQACFLHEDSQVSTICIQSLVRLVPEMSAAEIGSLLKDLLTLKISHRRLTDTIILLVPVIPCNDQELESITNSIISINAGTQEDRDFLLNLVKFRNVAVLD